MDEQKWLTSTDPTAMLAYLKDDAIDPRRDKPLRYDRKLRLFACACCRAVWSKLDHESIRQGIETAERYADGDATEEEIQAARLNLFEAGCASVYTALSEPWDSVRARELILGSIRSKDRESPREKRKPIAANQADLLRDVFGNPWNSHTLPGPGCGLYRGVGRFQTHSEELRCLLTWHDGTIPKFAKAMYDSRNFSDVLILYEMLYEAGCTNGPILNHCCKTELCHVCDGRGCGVKGEVMCEHCGGSNKSTRPGTGRRLISHVRGCWVIDVLLGRTQCLI